MELKDYSFDPMTFAFFENEDAELAERVGYALREGAKYFNITFGKNILATVSTWPEDEGATFHFSGGLGYDRQDDKASLEKHPEMREQILKYREKYDPYMRASHCLFRSKEYIELNEAGALWGGGWGGHSNPDFGRVINLGTEGIREIINKYKKINTEDSDWFYRGCEYAMDALDILGDRFHALALEEAAKCEDPADKKRYEAAARAFEVVPRKPAYDFTSACHVFWMIFTLDGIDSPGRFDQFMQRAYEATEDREEINDVLSRLWEVFHDTRTWNLCLSGSDENWNDDTNELTYDILKLAAEKKYQTPNITLRVHRNCPYDGGLIHRLCGSSHVLGAYVSSCAEHVGSIAHVVNSDSALVFLRLSRRVRAVCGVVNCAALRSCDSQLEGASVETALLRKFRQTNCIAALGSCVGISGSAVHNVVFAASVGVLSVGGIRDKSSKGDSIGNGAVRSCESDSFAGSRHSKGRDRRIGLSGS